MLWRIRRQTLRPKGCRERLAGLWSPGKKLEAARESVEIFISSEFAVT